MGIEFSFTAKPAVPSKGLPFVNPPRRSGPDDLLRVMERLMSPYECHGEVLPEDGCFRIHFCPHGYMTLQIRGDNLEGECQTNVAGPGFHAAAIDFLDDLMKGARYEAEVEDSTRYYEHRNFDQLRTENMYMWLADNLNAILEGLPQGAAFAACWDNSDYIPRAEKGVILTPLGKYDYSLLCDLAEREDIQELAGDFFIWVNRKKDACYFRNCALALMWRDCCFMPSKRSEQDRALNEKILAYLKEAARLNPGLPFPQKEYLEICRLAGKKPMRLNRFPDYNLFPQIGYRRGGIQERVGDFSVFVPGWFLKETDRQTGAVSFYDIKEYGYRTNYQFQEFVQDTPAQFGELYGGSEVRLIVDFDDELQGRAAVRHYDDPAEGDYNIIAQLLAGNRMLLCSFDYDTPAEGEAILDALREIRFAAETE